MATIAITPDQDAIVSEIHIAAPPARVFEALVEPAQVMSWWTGDNCQIESFCIDAKIGGRWMYNSKLTKKNLNGVSKFHCEGEIIEYDPPRTLAYTWNANWHDETGGQTIVRWELTPAAGGTDLKITHSGLADLPVARKDYSGGWPGVAAQLKKFVEN